MMDKLFCNLRFARVYLDDVAIFSKELKEHIKFLLQVFETIKKHWLELKMSKSLLFPPEVELLGHLVNYNGVSEDAGKIESTGRAPEPRNKNELQGFLG